MKTSTLLLGLALLAVPVRPAFAEKSVTEQASLGQKVVIIARVGPPESRDIAIQDFTINGEKVIPIFSDEAAFKQQTQGSKLRDQGIEIDVGLLLSMLHGDEILMLNPGGPSPRRLTVNDLRSMTKGH